QGRKETHEQRRSSQILGRHWTKTSHVEAQLDWVLEAPAAQRQLRSSLGARHPKVPRNAESQAIQRQKAIPGSHPRALRTAAGLDQRHLEASWLERQPGELGEAAGFIEVLLLDVVGYRPWKHVDDHVIQGAVHRPGLCLV